MIVKHITIPTADSPVMSKILLAEDDDLVSRTIADGLGKEGVEVLEQVISGKEALFRLTTFSYDLAILDWGLPELSGLEVCRQYRDQGGKIPILMLTGRSEIADKESGLDSGADDYLTKPFSMRELLARCRALLRRSPNLVSTELKVANIVLNTRNTSVHKDGVAVSLLPKEFSVLHFLLRNRNQTFDVDALLSQIWSSEAEVSEEAVRQTIARLRKKIESPGGAPIIKTRKGFGYVIEG